MEIVLAVIIGLLALPFLAVMMFIIYDAVLLIRRPLRRLYAKISAKESFVPIGQTPKQFKDILLLLEDVNFYKHHGIRPRAIRGSIRINRNAGRIVTGGSTITQQLMKNLYFHSFRKSYIRKIAEAFLALWAECVLSKDQILEMYINIIYYGNGIYGSSEAARFYFNKELQELNMNQYFLLSSIPKAPTRGNPIQHPEVFERIRNKNLDFYVECGRLSVEDKNTIVAHNASCLDEELRKADDYTDNYPQDIVLTNEKYGPGVFK